MNVLVVRNPHSRYEGIYVIGQSVLVEEYAQIVIDIIKRIEKLASKYRKNRNNTHIHFSEAKADFKTKCLKKYTFALDGIIDQLRVDQAYRDRARLRTEYLKQSTLKSKKAFNAKQHKNLGR